MRYSTAHDQVTEGPENGTISNQSAEDLVSAVYLQIDPVHHLRAQMNADEDADEEIDRGTGPITIYIVPETLAGTAPGETASTNPEKVRVLFDALSRCADLHPDEEDEGDREPTTGGLGGFSDGSLGGGGWITAENAHEFEESLGDASDSGPQVTILGPGAGIRRPRDEDQASGNAINGNGLANGDEDADETKWRRTD